MNDTLAAPLYSPSAIQYLESIIRPDWRVFEYGSGNSTTYYLAKCAEVRAVEHNNDWGSHHPDVITMVERDSAPLLDALPAESAFFGSEFELPRHPTSEGETEYHGMENWAWRGYASQIFAWPKGYFDVIAVDGMARSLCLWYAEMMVNPNGYIILDNSCRWQYNDLQEHLINRGWNRLDFWDGWCTSFFSRAYPASDLPIRRAKEVGDLYKPLGW